VTRVFPAERLESEALAVAHELAELPPGAVAACRKLIAGGAERTLEGAFAAENEVLASRYGSQENVAAVMAFLASRKR
jgi:enoyl-CoA hydratase/carnithine racemase